MRHRSITEKKRQDRSADRQPRRSVTRVLAAGLLALGIASGAGAIPTGNPPATPPLPQYAIVGLDIAPTSIDARPTSSAPNAINASGVIAGTAGGQAALSDLTGTHPLAGVKASGFNAWGLNDLGQVLVRSDIGSLLYYGGAMRTVAAVDGQDWWGLAWGVAINNAGQIVGTNGANVFMDPPHSPVNVLWWYGTTTDLGNFIPAAIDDAGQVAGTVPYDPNLIHTNMVGFTRRAAVWQGGTLKDLGVLPGDNASLATGINASGQVVGWSYRVLQGFANFNPHAFFYDGAAMHDLGTLGGLNGYGGGSYGGSVSDSDSEALGINDAGQIVGWSDPLGPPAKFSFQETHAFLYSGGVMIDLNDLLPADAKAHWVLNNATAINNAGQIIGSGYYMKDGMTPNGAGVWRSFLLTFPDDPRVALPAGPAPPPPAPLPLPAPPSGLAVKMASTTELDLTWTDNGAHEQAFEVQIADPSNPSLPWKEAGTVSASTTTFASTGLTGDTHYTYRVRAWNPAGASAWSNEAGGDTGVHPHADISPAGPLDFGTLPDGTPSAAQTVTISNSGNGPLDIASIKVSGANAGDFALVPTATPLHSVAPGGSGSVQLVFTPTGAGSRSATLTIAHDAPGGSSTVALTGNGVAPIVRLSPAALDFARQPVGLSGDLSLLLRNTGTVPLTVGKLTFQGPDAGDFSLATDGVTGETLQPGDIVLLNVRFTPTQAGSRSASLAITDNAMDSPQLVSLTGTGTAPLLTLSADALVFGVQPASATQTLVLTNGGDAPLAVKGVDLTGPDAGHFQILSDSGEPSLAVGASRTLTIGFNPATSATIARRSRQARSAAARIAAVGYNATLEIHDNDPHPGAPHSVVLTALGAAASAPAATAPAAPTNLAAVVTPAPQVALTWTNNSSNETALAIWRQKDGGRFIRIGVVAPHTTNFTDAGMTPNTSYTYEVRATNNSGASPWSNLVTVVTPDVAPAGPTNLTATLTPVNQVALTWTVHSQNETALAIWRQTGGSAWVRVGVVVPQTTHFTDTSVAPSNTYTYEVRAINNSGASPWSNRVSAATLEAAPAAPTNLTATVGVGEIDLTWTRGKGNETGISIFRQVGEGAWVRIGVVVPSATHYADRSVQAGRSYRYQVRAHNSHFASAWTHTVTVLTPAAP